MAQHRFKIILAAGGLAVALTAGVSHDARAFTETKVPPAQPQATQPAQQLQLQKPEAGDGLSLVKPGDQNSGGTELSIPGVGTLGTVPKLDFGLDLLYGAGSDPAQPERPQEGAGNQDVTIKGTIRHRF
jgi:hypothetical protein